MSERATHAEAPTTPARQTCEVRVEASHSKKASPRNESPDDEGEVKEKTRSTRGGNAPGPPVKGLSKSGTELPTRSPHAPRLSFEDFAAQLRLHKYHSHKVELLKQRQEGLRRSLALFSRLCRVGSWVHDGLVELSGHADRAGFARVHKQMHDLVDIFCSSSRRHLDPFEPLMESGSASSAVGGLVSDSFVPKLSAGSRAELFNLLRSIRSDPQFLVERIKTLSQLQLSSLEQSVRPRVAPLPVVSPLNRGIRNSQKKRMEAFSYGLEECAFSLERSNPLSFILFNAFGFGTDSASSECSLRLQTWSTVCASLFVEADQRFHPLVSQVLSMFAKLSPWGAKERLELFLMDVLQRGAFLVDLVQSSPIQTSADSPQSGMSNIFGTQEAEDFFDEAILNLFDILDDQHGGLPGSVSGLACAILGRLPSIEDQSQFRGHVFIQWFLREFLRITITFPENENMLLRYHISKAARDNLLHHLWRHADASVLDVFNESPSRPVNSSFKSHVQHMISRLIPVPVLRHGLNRVDAEPVSASEVLDDEDCQSRPILLISAADIVNVLNGLCPSKSMSGSLDPFVSSSASAFNAQYSHVATKLDKLRTEISIVTDLRSFPQLVHPCQESWTLLIVNADGQPSEMGSACARQISPAAVADLQIYTRSQRAALKLVEECRTSVAIPPLGDETHSSTLQEGTLGALFQEEHIRSQERADSVGAFYWHKALQDLRKHHPGSTLWYDDTKVLQPILQASEIAHQRCVKLGIQLENSFSQMRSAFDQLRASMSDFTERLDNLRTKMWYIVDVVNSNIYEDTDNVASALNHMAVTMRPDLPLEIDRISGQGRRQPSSSSSSLLEQPRRDAMSILKAPSEHGGPKKLADVQVERMKKWLQSNSVDNFCKGEERIHRFCMEIRIAARKLIGENMNESPVLWASELFAKEKMEFDNVNPVNAGAQIHTRPSSVISEAVSLTYHSSRLGYRGLDGGLRGQLYESHNSPGRKASFHSLGSSRQTEDIFGSDRLFTGSSPGRAASATTSEAVSSLWSPQPSYSRSATSISARSRPQSIYNDADIAKAADQNVQEKAKFLEQLHHDLICLLLSDLGCPVWSCGSETDAWLQKVSDDNLVQQRTRQRVNIEHLISAKRSGIHSKGSQPIADRKGKKKRSISAAPRMSELHGQLADNAEHQSNTGTQKGVLQSVSFEVYPYVSAYQTLLDKFSQEVDPARKIEAVYDFKTLALLQGTSKSTNTASPSSPWKFQLGGSVPSSRRGSLDPRVVAHPTRKGSAELTEGLSHVPGGIAEQASEADIVDRLKEILLTLRPKTLFRDLQYVSAFVPLDVLNKTERGKAFLHFGLAALAYKEETCHSMADVANKIVSHDLIKRQAPWGGNSEPSLLKVAEYWLLAAREGNAVAQRELASLYLTCPEPLPVVSLPMSLASDTFKNEMMWQRADDERVSTPKLCLALHWMQQAASNGDEVAKRKLRERDQKGKDAFR